MKDFRRVHRNVAGARDRVGLMGNQGIFLLIFLLFLNIFYLVKIILIHQIPMSMTKMSSGQDRRLNLRATTRKNSEFAHNLMIFNTFLPNKDDQIYTFLHSITK